MKFRILSMALGILLSSASWTQEELPENGPQHWKDKTYAFTNAVIHVTPDQEVKGTLLVVDGKVAKLGFLKSIPKGAIRVDLDGKHIYPSFIDMHQGVPGEKKKNTGDGIHQDRPDPGAHYWNQACHPEYRMEGQYFSDTKKIGSLRGAGIGFANVHVGDGLMRGTASLFSTSDDPAERTILSQTTDHYSLSKGNSNQPYPSSQMGAIALLRQFHDDAQWHQAQQDKPANMSYEAYFANEDLPHVFSSTDILESLRILELGKTLDREFIIATMGDDYKHLDELSAANVKLILPLMLPKAYDMTDPYLSRFVSLSKLKHWEAAPFNALLVKKAGIEFAFTTRAMKSPKELISAIRTLYSKGLSKADILKALTVTPAGMLGIQERLGTLEDGKEAHFFITDKDLITDGGKILEHWIQGRRYEVTPPESTDISGEYDLVVDGQHFPLKIAGQSGKYKGSVTLVETTDSAGIISTDTNKVSVKVALSGNQVSMSYPKGDGVVSLNGTYLPSMSTFEGRGTASTGDWVKWAAIGKPRKKEQKDEEPLVVDTSFFPHISYPNMAFGFDSLPAQEDILFKNATVWTNEKEGVLKNTDVFISKGKIARVGKGLRPSPQARVIDCTGKHLTCGIVDEHSHIAISKGVNEGGQAISAEVNIGDVVRNNDINIYRQLAGGVTTAQLLHGSANPIGGQSALVKLKWGHTPQQMLIDGADGFIKFALGENVKQTNWSPRHTHRYPQTRMGVEQVYYDAFLRAKAYKQQWQEWNSLSEKKRKELTPPRRDEELEILVQVLDQKRFITCHSYIQSEINMLMKVADSMGFRINTFTHILEGYKVADKMREHGAFGSTFSDWWAYKYEVKDATPWNGALMHEQGVLTGFNSDDAEMARRLNQEAAKAVKYGGVSEEEAWKFVTLNPAKMLHLDDKIGSIKAGKDADLVIWSDNPLSIMAKAETTLVDGAVMFDLQQSRQLEIRDAMERKRITKKMMHDKGPKEQPKEEKKVHYHCDTIGE